jgi:metacaspase-1
VLLEACREDQLSYEYRRGVTSYGAFTYSLAKDLRAQPRITFEKIILKTTATLKDLGYDQNPQLVGPKPVTSKTIPGLVAQRRSPRRRRQRR